MNGDLIEEYKSKAYTLDKSWKEFQMERLSGNDKQRVYDIETYINMNHSVIEMLTKRIDDFTKAVRESVRKLEVENEELCEEYEKLIYPDCNYCSGASYSRHCDGNECW